MNCNYNGPCPYEDQCTDCLYNSYENTKRLSTGMSDMKTYKREYMQRKRQQALEKEIFHAGVMKNG